MQRSYIWDFFNTFSRLREKTIIRIPRNVNKKYRSKLPVGILEGAIVGN
jgi:hypothetical protein